MDFEEFIKEIEEYESDTFSSSGSKITKEEAKKVAESLLHDWADQHLDGICIDIELGEIRD